ncbi:hypothetical protein GCM10009630_37860 [Kribbella jejuensis]|uniref:Uncharacterized protein n=1 Tax=Kribbella jejuensis TaxID=236068 RepID=A0A542ESE3_9ACTN|nr:hypothetical protein [Kribbella jejuensis]TQJ18261.1 hypothetical protein FB475_2396 [Kribbella jejuensis]
MEDVREVSAELHRLAADEPLEPFDTTRILERGRRGRRRRRLLGVGGAAAGVAAVALVVSLVPNLTAADKQPTVAGSQQHSALFEPVPGVPSGEDGADQRISKEEATRRCALRNPQEHRQLSATGGFRSGSLTTYDLKNGAKEAQCIIPGGDRPTAALVAEVRRLPATADVAGQLKICSVLAWVDVTNWQVVAVDRSKALGQAVLVAVSPSGRKAMSCNLLNDKTLLGGPGSTRFLTLTDIRGDDPALDPADKSARTDLYVAGGGGGPCSTANCSTYNLTGWGRVASKDATDVRLRIGSGPVYKVPVSKGGWFAFTWVNTSRSKLSDHPKVAAYDRSGKLVKTFQ